MNRYTPRRCSKRWLDGDCPAGVLAIMDHPAYIDRYTVLYNDPVTVNYGRLDEMWLSYLALDADGRYYHGEMQAHEVAAYRYRNKHRYVRWSTLPDAVKNAVWADLKAAADYVAAENARVGEK